MEISIKTIFEERPASPVGPSSIADSARSTTVKPFTKSFDDLSPELMQMIVDACEDGDLANLRLVSKFLALHVWRTFSTTKFKHLRHHLTKQSLGDLINIVKHNSFGPTIKSIEFSTARTEDFPYHSIQDHSEFKLSINQKGNDFLRSGEHIEMLTEVFKHLKRHDRLDVVIGLFDCSTIASTKLKPQKYIIPWIRGHGYLDAFGEEGPRGTDPQSTMFAISRSAIASKYSLRHLSMRVPVDSHTVLDLTQSDRSRVLYNEDASEFNNWTDSLKSGLSLRIDFFDMDPARLALTVEVDTNINTRVKLRLEGKTVNENFRIQARIIRHCLVRLPYLANGTESREVIIKGLTLDWWGVEKFQFDLDSTVELLELSEMIIGDPNPEENEEHPALDFFRILISNATKLTTLKISYLKIVKWAGGEKQTLDLAVEEVVAQGHDQVRNTYNSLMSQIENW